MEKKYHDIGRIEQIIFDLKLTVNSKLHFKFFFIKKWKTKNTTITDKQNNRRNRDKPDTPYTQIYEHWLGTGTSIKGVEVKIFVWVKTSSLSEF